MLSHFVEEKRCEARDLREKDGEKLQCKYREREVSEAYYNEALEESCDKIQY